VADLGGCAHGRGDHVGGHFDGVDVMKQNQLYVGESLTLGIRITDGASGQPLEDATVVADLWAPGVDRAKAPPTMAGVEMLFHPRFRDYLTYVHTDASWPLGRWTYRITSRRVIDGETHTNISFSYFNLQP
jgi:hypothetical protein